MINEEDLMIIIRFYYKSTGKAAEVDNMMFKAGNRDGEEEEPAMEVPMFYAAQGQASAKQTPTGVNEVRYLGEIVSQTYYNIQGMESDKPFDGINIVVTRFSNGTTSVSKVVR